MVREFFDRAFEYIVNNINTEWVAAYITLALTLVSSFIVQAIAQKSTNKISRSDFVYRINEDFSTNEKILKVYDWIEKCRRKNMNILNYRSFNPAFSKNAKIGFSDLDTYINLFESVFVIRGSLKKKHLDKLFQQRFLTFMHNPYVQKTVLFPCFKSNNNLFSLYKKWIKMPYRRCHYSSFRLAEYLKEYTCGIYEYALDMDRYNKLNWLRKICYRWKKNHYIKKYVWNLCNPNCKYGYFWLPQDNKASSNKPLAVRIIRSNISDLDDIISLQEKIKEHMKNPEHYQSSTKDELQTALLDPFCIPIQIDINNRIVAFAYVILKPNEEYRLSLLVGNEKKAPKRTAASEAVLETVFVDEEYRGYGMQNLLIDILCRMAKCQGAKSIWAVIHPENHFSFNNFIKNGFEKVNSSPVKKYDNVRDVYCRDITHLRMKDRGDARYCVYPGFTHDFSHLLRSDTPIVSFHSFTD